MEGNYLSSSIFVGKPSLEQEKVSLHNIGQSQEGRLTRNSTMTISGKARIPEMTQRFNSKKSDDGDNRITTNKMPLTQVSVTIFYGCYSLILMLSQETLFISPCTGAEVRFPLPALILLQSPWVRDLLYIT